MYRPRVLVVDDEANARSALSELLCDSGYDVAVAASGKEGLALVDSFHPDVMLTDVRMPGMTGTELEQATRGKPWAPKVVYMSAYARPRAATGPWLSKPLDINELLDTLGSLDPHRKQ
jgi:two-component system response regulator AtoC